MYTHKILSDKNALVISKNIFDSKSNFKKQDTLKLLNY